MTKFTKPLLARAAGPLKGTAPVPGDKSISHRALIFGGLAHGETVIHGLLESEDVLATANAIAALGAAIEGSENGTFAIKGTGCGAMRNPEDPLDLGNSGTGARLLMGLVAGQGLTATFVGDASLQNRPMGRILDPLQQMGAVIIDSAPNHQMPLTLQGTVPAIPLEYVLPVPSAQVKSAVLIAGLGAIGHTIVHEDEPTRDHTERMLRHFGADLTVTENAAGRTITVRGEANLSAREVHVPGDPSSAAFPLVAGLIVPDSEICIQNVMINPTRSGLFTTLQEMGADLAFENERDAGGEPVADIRARFGALKSVDVAPGRAPSMIDEYPILAVAAAFAQGTSILRGLGELRVKESDRLAAIVAGLTANGITATIEGDDLTILGCGGEVPGGGRVETHLDHRIAMSFLVMGMASKQPVTVDDSLTIATSFPKFEDLMTSFGASFEEV